MGPSGLHLQHTISSETCVLMDCVRLGLNGIMSIQTCAHTHTAGTLAHGSPGKRSAATASR